MESRARPDVLDRAAVWQRVVDLGARGKYADASNVATDLLGTTDRWASLALATLASHRRQVGDMEGAQELDTHALRTAGDEESRADALIGLAADAVGSGDAAEALLLHGRAESDAHACWRTHTRWCWVGAEAALLAGDPVTAQVYARGAVVAARGHSARHVAKSHLVHAAATGDVACLQETELLIAEGGWTTLVWPLALIAGDHADRWDSVWLGRVWAAGVAATYDIESALPADLLPHWRSHPGVRRLREDGALPRGG